MDVNKLRAALNAAKKETNDTVTSTVTAAQKSPVLFKSLPRLVKINELLDKALEKLDEAIEAGTPKAKEEKPAKADKK